ncbi:hypothetical protein ACFV4N_17385 [Actinosynnema sp. NPDC059797]
MEGVAEGPSFKQAVVEGVPTAPLFVGFMLAGYGQVWWALGAALLSLGLVVAQWRWRWGEPSVGPEVRRALWRGEGVGDPRLAGPLLEVADAALARPYKVWPYRVVFAVPAVIGVGALVLGFPEEGRRSLSTGVFAISVSVLWQFVLLPLAGRQRKRTARSAELTRRDARVTWAPPGRSRRPPRPPAPGSTGPACPSPA